MTTSFKISEHKDGPQGHLYANDRRSIYKINKLKKENTNDHEDQTTKKKDRKRHEEKNIQTKNNINDRRNKNQTRKNNSKRTTRGFQNQKKILNKRKRKDFQDQQRKFKHEGKRGRELQETRNNANKGLNIKKRGSFSSKSQKGSELRSNKSFGTSMSAHLFKNLFDLVAHR